MFGLSSLFRIMK